MAQTKKQKDKDAALVWLKLQGNKAFENQNKKEVEIITYLLRELAKPDYSKELIKINKHMQRFGSMDYAYFCKNVPNPNTKPKTINQKANKRT